VNCLVLSNWNTKTQGSIFTQCICSHLDYLNQAKTTNSKGFIATTEKVISESVPFNIVAYPNPSTSYFAVVNGGSNEKVVKV
jgi:hypothetical protein